MRLLLSQVVATLLLFSCTDKYADTFDDNIFTVVNYNVENLFDTIDDPHKNDNAFTPGAKKHYTEERYRQKLINLSKVISSINKKELPEVISFEEVENIDVLIDLVNTPLLKDANYNVILEEGPDPRGIDCGFIYRPDVFEYIEHQTIEVRLPVSNRRTRDILYVKGVVNGDTVHFFVNHWSSRMGGIAKTEYKRVQAAIELKYVTDSLLRANSNANIVILGDFNDEPDDKSLLETLDAEKPGGESELVNISFPAFESGEGTYSYRGKFLMLDNIIVSDNLIDKTSGFRLQNDKASVFAADFMKYVHKNGTISPFKTYGGSTYYGGYSDHFPVYAVFYEE